MAEKSWSSYVIGAVFMAVCLGIVFYAVKPNCDQQDLTGTETLLSEQKKTSQSHSGHYLSVVKHGCKNDKWKYSKEDRLKYRENYGTIPGWMQEPIPYYATTLSKYQREIGICGDVGEIGVHRGLFGTAICHTMTINEKYLAADIFDLDIGINTAGDLFRENTVDKFTDNLHKFGIKPKDYIVKRADSTKLHPSDFINASIGPFRFFSVDGGHSKEVVLSDIKLVSQIIVEGGIVAMDDWDAGGWDGIRQGFAEYFISFTERDLPLLPFLFGNNKMFVTTKSHHQIYTDFLLNHPVLKQLVRHPKVEGPWSYLVIGGGDPLVPGWIDLINETS